MIKSTLVRRSDAEIQVSECVVQTLPKDVTIRYRAAAMLANTYAGNRKFEQGLSILNEMLPMVRE